MNLRKAILTLIAIMGGSVALNEAKADEILDEFLRTDTPQEQDKNNRGYFSLSQLFYPDGHKTKASTRANLDRISLYLSGANVLREHVGSNRGFGLFGIELPIAKDFEVKPFVWGEAKTSYGQTSLEHINRGGAGIEAHARINNRLDLKGILLQGFGDYKIENADGTEGILKSGAGLRALLHLGKGHYIGVFGKSSRLRYDHLGKIEQNDAKIKYFFIRKPVSFGIGIGNTSAAYNPGRDFSSPYVEGNLDFRLSKSADSPVIRVHGRHFFNGENRLHASPIPSNEVGISLVIPWGYSKKQKAKKESTQYQGVFYKPRGLIGGRKK